MRDEPRLHFKRVLEPVERISEILFGLIMVLTLTLSFNFVGHGDVRSLLVGAIGCNLAWGIIDAGFYLLGCIAERGHNLLLLRQVQTAVDPANARRIISDAMPPLLASLLPEKDVEVLRQELVKMPPPPGHIPLRKEDGVGALGVFLLCFLSTFPVVIPFLLFQNAKLALAISNAVALLMLVVAGYALGRHASDHAWRFGVAMVLLGGAMVGVAMALGG